ncbi:WecB/TagA/CpsF family glycosyltransferase [Spirulina sp. CCNP1310]|uniref:WecB/TagA/CpsF family glycosyltransferase n=1 Tax=Spirulina sp. CCNP1310 TaxID=3110249 RepID=UPI002B1ECADC|nr:WecB/TagA/CpsF family glycosyltransferase [Spirulina sp. CCNP1310]MEA5417718.1 WecB/TagA/CpsF family glycosyltransferase [Spirulina sp. CCNP1310]
MSKINILNITIDNLSLAQLLDDIKQGGFVVTPNADHLIQLQNDPEFFHVYRNADYVICDSQILIYISWFFGKKIREKISGSDFFPAFYWHYRNDPDIRIFLLGAGPGVALQAQKNINEKVGREMVVATYSPSYGFEKNEAECHEIIDMINATNANVLAVGLGAPKQEKWIYKYRSYLKEIKIFLAIGATIDFEAGVVPRAPRQLSETGLEWVYRLAREPRRLWRRYLLGIIPMLSLILRQKLGIYRFKKPLGLLLHEAGLLTMHQVEVLLVKQAKDPDQRFGELAIQHGWLEPKTVHFFLVELPRWLQKHYAHRLLDYLEVAGLLSHGQIEALQVEQQSDPRALEQLAIERGWIKPKTVEFFQRVQDLAHRPQINSFESVYFYKPSSN